MIPDNLNCQNMVMRSYQIQATRAILERLKVMSSHNIIEKEGGYVWHTTGSGKTVTSFKVSQLIAMRPYINEVLFVVDRVDLINQTYHNFVDYADAQFKNRIHVRKGYQLKNYLAKKKSTSEISLITLQGLHKIVKKGLTSNKRMIIIMDEAHRSASGNAVSDIKKALSNTTWFGFTGTPNFYSDEESDIKTSSRLSTHDVFGDRLHQYTIRDAIGDKNVLGFDISYMDFSAELDEETPNEEPLISEKEIYSSELYKASVVEDIGENWHKYANARSNKITNTPNYFSGMLAVSGKSDVISYYNYFRQMFPKLNVAMTYSKDDANSEKSVMYDEMLKTAIKAYQEKYHTINFLTQPDSARLYIDDITKRLAHKGVYQNIDDENRLDLVIVADQLLTGFDSKYVNMMYIDKSLQESGLIQAISRANRVLDMSIKPYAKIRFYREPEKMQNEVERALTIYTQGGLDTLSGENIEDVDLVDTGILARDMVDIIKSVNDKLVDLRKIAGYNFETPILSELEQISFVNTSQPAIADIQLLLTQGYDFGDKAVHQLTHEEAVLNLSSGNDYGKLKARTNDTLKVIPEESKSQIIKMFNVSLTEYDTEMVNYDTLTSLLQDYQLKKQIQVKQEILNWASSKSDLHTRLVQNILSSIDSNALSSKVTYEFVHDELLALKKSVIESQLFNFGHEHDVPLPEMLNIYEMYTPGEKLVDNQDLKMYLSVLKKEHHWNMRENLVFKNKLMLFLDNL